MNYSKSNMIFCVLLILVSLFSSQSLAEFENLGKPIQQGFLLNYSAGPDAQGENTKVYFAFHQPTRALLVQVTPGKKKSEQFVGPDGITGPWGFAIGPDKKIYLGCSGHILVFDPARPEKQLVDLGKPVESETVIWRLAVGADDKIYGSTYPNCKLVSYDPATGKMADLGRLDEKEEYGRPLVAAKDGWLYAGVGPQRGNVTAYNPTTGEMKPILKDSQRPDEWGRVGGWYLAWEGEDGYAYGEIGDKTYKFINGEGKEIPADQASPRAKSQLADGRELMRAKADGTYGLKAPGEQEKKFEFEYFPDCPDVFLLTEGPDDKIYGSTITPLVVFSYDPATSTFKDIGKVTASGGEVYSFANYKDEIFICSYPEAKLSRYNPSQKASYGTNPENNPFDYGAIGADQSRPRAMVVGPDDMIYIGGYPNYGKLGSVLSVFDPGQNKIVDHIEGLVEDQSIISLAVSKDHGLVFGGTSITGGNGIDPVATEAHFFAWDTQKKKKTIDIVPVPGHKHIMSMCVLNDKVYMMTAKKHSTFGGVSEQTCAVVFDIKKGRIIHRTKFDFGRPIDTSLAPAGDGMIYGLTDKGIFSIDPKNGSFSIEASSPVKIEYGFVLNEKGIYFASGPDVWRYNW